MSKSQFQDFQETGWVSFFFFSFSLEYLRTSNQAKEYKKLILQSIVTAKRKRQKEIAAIMKGSIISITSLFKNDILAIHQTSAC